MKAAVAKFHVPQLHCMAHIIHLTVQEAIQKCSAVKEIIEKVGSIVTYFKQNVTTQACLEEEQDATNRAVLKLIQSVPTRWNSSCAMLERFLQLASEVAIVLLKFDNAPEMVKKSDLKEIEDIIKILNPFKVIR